MTILQDTIGEIVAETADELLVAHAEAPMEERELVEAAARLALEKMVDSRRCASSARPTLVAIEGDASPRRVVDARLAVASRKDGFD